ncbi:MAG: GYD domain-containing protein, partial [Alphaproteobacteria bacterium]
EDRGKRAAAKVKELGITVESMHYTQGPIDFVEVVDAPSGEAMLALSLWYAKQGYGKLQSLPAYDRDAMARAESRA